jgi:polyketide cyclase/dehydrase/lipid transport protein
LAQASASIRLPAPPAEVWRLIGGFGSLPDWLPFIPKSELGEGGRVRHLATADGAAIVERLVSFNDAERSYSYAILQSPFPVTDYVSTLSVKEADGSKGSRVEWSGEFTANGVSDAEATRLFQAIYEDGLKALAAAFSTRKQ